MKKGGFLRRPSPVWAVPSSGVPPEAARIADRAGRLLELRNLIWRVDLWLVVVLLVSHVSLKFVVPGFPAAEALATELGVLESATLMVTRRMMKKEKELEREYVEITEAGSLN